MATLTITGASSSGGNWAAEINYNTSYNSGTDTSTILFTSFRVHKGSSTNTPSTTSATWYLIVNNISYNLGNISYTVPAYGNWGNSVGISIEINNLTPGSTVSVSLDDPWNNLYYSNNSARFANATAAARSAYTITYNANGGNGSLANQSKYADVPLVLRNGGYWKQGYLLWGWSESSTATTPTWYLETDDPQALLYRANKATTIYAVWKPIVNMIYAKSGSSWVIPVVKVKADNVWVPCVNIKIVNNS